MKRKLKAEKIEIRKRPRNPKSVKGDSRFADIRSCVVGHPWRRRLFPLEQRVSELRPTEARGPLAVQGVRSGS